MMYCSDSLESYRLSLGHEFNWTFNGTVGTEQWLRKFARTMELARGPQATGVQVGFVRSRDGWITNSTVPGLLGQLRADHLPRVGWRCEDFNRVRLWYHPDLPDLMCELTPAHHYAADVLLMWYSMHVLYPDLCQRGGLPIHAALLQRDGVAVLLVAGEGTGKSTSCRRLASPWKALSDDLALVVPTGDGRYFAHPLPTWSDHIVGKWDQTWNVQQGVRLRGIFFLEQSHRDKSTPIGQGQTAVAITKSASYVLTRDWRKKDANRARTLRKTLFSNATVLAQNVPAFLLESTLTGEFWTQMENALT
jgi:SynChlorMet cassette protein ScmC